MFFLLLSSFIAVFLASFGFFCGQTPKSAENKKGDAKKKASSDSTTGSKDGKDSKGKASKEIFGADTEHNKRPRVKPVEPNSFDQLQPREMWCERKKQITKCANEEIPHADKENISNYATFKCLDKDDCEGLE